MMLANTLYSSAVMPCLSIGYSRKMILWKVLDYIGVVIVDVAMAMAAKDMLIKQRIKTADILY